MKMVTDMEKEIEGKAMYFPHKVTMQLSENT